MWSQNNFAQKLINMQLQNNSIAKLSQDEQKQLVTNIAIINLKNRKFAFSKEQILPDVESFCDTIKEIYFDLAKNLQTKNCKKSANKYFEFVNKQSEPILTRNIDLNLIVLKQLIKHENNSLSIKIINRYLKSKDLSDFNKFKLLRYVLPIIKYKDFNQYLLYSEQYEKTVNKILGNLILMQEDYFNIIVEKIDISEKLEALKINSFTDQLTNCLNRKALEETEVNFKQDHGAAYILT